MLRNKTVLFLSIAATIFVSSFRPSQAFTISCGGGGHRGSPKTMAAGTCNTEYACLVWCDSASDGKCGNHSHDTHQWNGQDICSANLAPYAGCDRDICRSVCDGQSLPYLNPTTGSRDGTVVGNRNVTYDGRVYTCFNASSLIQNSTEEARMASFAYNCGQNTTHQSRYGPYPGTSFADCVDTPWNTESLRNVTTNHSTPATNGSNTPYACAVTCSVGGANITGCGTHKTDTLPGVSGTGFCAIGEEWAGCDRDVCQTVCAGTSIASYSNVETTVGGKNYTCFNTTQVSSRGGLVPGWQRSLEAARIASYALNCAVNTSSAYGHGYFFAGANSSQCGDGNWNTEALAIAPPPPSPPPPSPPPPSSPSPPPTTGAPQDDSGISGARTLSSFVLFVHTLGLSFLM